jgi:hypothetical protein
MKSLESLAAKRGLRVEDRGSGHLQIVGGSCLVNYYPESKRGSAYISGATGKARSNVTPGQAIEMAFEPAPEGWRKPSEPIAELPAKRTAEEWGTIMPRMRFGWKKGEPCQQRS